MRWQVVTIAPEWVAAAWLAAWKASVEAEAVSQEQTTKLDKSLK